MHEAIGDRFVPFIYCTLNSSAGNPVYLHHESLTYLLPNIHSYFLLPHSFHAILVDNGVMRLNECATVKKTLGDKMGINIQVADASDLFLSRLVGITDPERKRKIIGNTFIEVFEAEAAKIDKENGGKIEYLLQGTLYPDVIESISFKGPSATIKTHHVSYCFFKVGFNQFWDKQNGSSSDTFNASIECRWSPRGHEIQAN